MAKMRLDRLLAGQGTQTRKEVRELIRKGRVTVNGQPEKAADRQVEPLTDVIEVDGVPLRVREHVYLMLHKPQGVVSATEDRASAHCGGSGAAGTAPEKSLPRGPAGQGYRGLCAHHR